MAVIITDMDMPLTCEKCEYPKCGLYKTSWYSVNEDVDYTTAKYHDCPLRSADEMITEIKNEAWPLNNGEFIKDYVIDLDDIEQIFHKYCDKGAKE